LPVDPLDSVFEALVDAALPVTFFAISSLWCDPGGGGARNPFACRKLSCPTPRRPSARTYFRPSTASLGRSRKPPRLWRIPARTI
jgi:hypothetical protein